MTITLDTFAQTIGVKTWKPYRTSLEAVLTKADLSVPGTQDLGQVVRDHHQALHAAAVTTPGRLNETVACLHKIFKLSFPSEPLPIGLQALSLESFARQKDSSADKAARRAEPCQVLVGDIIHQAERWLELNDPAADECVLIALWLAIAPGFRAFFPRVRLVAELPDTVDQGDVVCVLTDHGATFLNMAIKRGEGTRVDTAELEQLYPESAHLVPEFLQVANRIHNSTPRDGTERMFRYNGKPLDDNRSKVIGAIFGKTSQGLQIGQDDLRRAAVFDDECSLVGLDKDARVAQQRRVARRLELRNHTAEVADSEYLRTGVPLPTAERRKNFRQPSAALWAGLRKHNQDRAQQRAQPIDPEAVTVVDLPESPRKRSAPAGPDPAPKRPRLDELAPEARALFEQRRSAIHVKLVQQMTDDEVLMFE